MQPAEYEAQIPGISLLFQKVFKRPISAEYLRWRYIENLPKITLAATEMRENRLVAHSVATPAVFCLKGARFLSGMVAVVMTDPEFQGQGLFQKLTTDLEAEMRDLQFNFTYAFPNRNSDPIFLSKLEWIPILDIPNMQLKVSEIHPTVFNLSDRIWTEDSKFSSSGYDALTKKNIGSESIHIPRTQEFLQWRYGTHPTNQYLSFKLSKTVSELPEAFIVLKKYEVNGETQMDWVDYSLSSDSLSDLLIDQVISVARSLKAGKVNTWAVRGKSIHASLLKRGASLSDPITHFSLKIFNLSPDDSRVLEAGKNWWITMGDSDVY